MKTMAELTWVKGSFVLVRLNKSRFHCRGYTSALSLKQLTADNAIFCYWGIKSLRDRCYWTDWYRASRTLYIMQSARDLHPAWACRLHSTLGLFGTLVLPMQGPLSCWEESYICWPGAAERGHLVQFSWVSVIWGFNEKPVRSLTGDSVACGQLFGVANQGKCLSNFSPAYQVQGSGIWPRS